MSKARLKQMLLQTDMFLEHQYSTGCAEGEGKTAQIKSGKAAQKGSCRTNAKFPPCAIMRTDRKSWLITLEMKRLDINYEQKMFDSDFITEQRKRLHRSHSWTCIRLFSVLCN